MTKKKRFVSLKLRALIILIIAIAVAALTFEAVRNLGNFLMWRYYLEEATTQEREQGHIERLQKYVADRKITADDTDSVLAWSEGRFVDVVIYQNSDLIYSPDWFSSFDSSNLPDSFRESEFYESWFSGDRGFEKYLTEDARNKYRETLDGILEGNQELHPLYCVDGTLLVAFVDYSAEIAHNVVLAVSFICAIAVIAIVMIISLSKLAGRVNKLASDVRLAAGEDINAPIAMEGNDDITSLAHDIDSMRKSLIENMEKERHAWEANSALITAMSHDIRTPLTVLMGYLDLIELSDQDSANAEYIAVCRENAERLKKLSDDMFSYFLVFGKKDMGLSPKSISVAGEISVMIAEHSFLLSERGYKIVGKGDMPEDYVNADPVYFSRVIDNIFSNIVKYADPEKEIIIEARKKGDCVEISFENKTRKDKIIPESNRIGLKTCSKIMEQMGGELSVAETSDSFAVTVKLMTEAHNDSSADT